MTTKKMEVTMEENTGMTDRHFRTYNKLIIFALKLIEMIPEEQREQLKKELLGIMSAA